MNGTTYRSVTACRVCEGTDLTLVHSFGETPLANSFVSSNATEPEERFPLTLVRCGHCTLVQLSVVVAPEIMFRNYLYTSSTSSPMIRHFSESADELVARFSLTGALAVEIGSNDGILLRQLVSRGARVLGVEPASNLASRASAEGLETWNEFFSDEVARRIVSERGPVRLIAANNVMAHVDQLGGMARGIEHLLAPDGALVMEVPYLVDLLSRVEYDTVYHEHLSYFSLRPLMILFERSGLEVFDVRRLNVHGGSLRVFAARRGAHPVTGAVSELLRVERVLGLDGARPYAEFSKRVAESRAALIRLLAELKARGARIAGYGAAAKGNTLLNYCDIDSATVEFVVDSTPAKQGLLTPGTRIPVVPEVELIQRSPGYTLLLAWNYADTIIARNRDYVRTGGHFIHPIPMARILEA